MTVPGIPKFVCLNALKNSPLNFPSSRADNQRSDQITLFRVERKTGLLTFTGRYQPVGNPMCITHKYRKFPSGSKLNWFG
jgi:hypothetical protein